MNKKERTNLLKFLKKSNENNLIFKTNYNLKKTSKQKINQKL